MSRFGYYIRIVRGSITDAFNRCLAGRRFQENLGRKQLPAADVREVSRSNNRERRLRQDILASDRRVECARESVPVDTRELGLLRREV